MADLTPKRAAELTEAKAALTKELQAWSDRFGLTAEENLAVCAYITGTVLAVQDPRVTTPRRAMEIVNANITAGNRAIVDFALAAPAGSA